MKKKYTFTLIAFFIILFSNLPPVAGFLYYMFDTDLHKYSNSNGTMTFEDKKHADEYRTAINRHEGCLLIQPDLKDKKLYRLFMINPLAFWRWRLYFTKEYYKFPYKNWKEIEKNRAPVPMPEKGYCIIDF